MKKYGKGKMSLSLLALCLIGILLFSGCGNSEIITEIDENETFSVSEVFDLTSDENTIVIEDGTNYILLTMSDGVVVKAEYAYQFGTADLASAMYEYYEENGYDTQYSSGRLNEIYLILEYKDSSAYLGMTEEEVSGEYDGEITDGYF